MKVGDKWKEWTVESLLGEGQFGKVYKLVRTEFGHVYESALKVIRIPQNESEYRSVRSEGMDDDSITAYYRSVVESIISECSLMYELKGNSNIVSYEGHQVVELEDSFGWEIYIKMELLTPLLRRLESGNFTEQDTINLGIDICKALEICQSYNIIHRDIKPENVFLSKQGNYKLGDFGIARRMESATTGMSKKGTYTYMAPEVYSGQPYNATVDTYSLGIMLYRLANHYRAPFMPPYPEKVTFKDKEQSTIKRITGQPIPVPDDASEELAAIILKACAFSPKERYQSAADMRADLERIQTDKETASKPLPAVVKVEETDRLSAFSIVPENASDRSGEMSFSLEDEDDSEMTMPLIPETESSELSIAGEASGEEAETSLPSEEAAPEQSYIEEEETSLSSEEAEPEEPFIAEEETSLSPEEAEPEQSYIEEEKISLFDEAASEEPYIAAEATSPYYEEDSSEYIESEETAPAFVETSSEALYVDTEETVLPAKTEPEKAQPDKPKKKAAAAKKPVSKAVIAAIIAGVLLLAIVPVIYLNSHHKVPSIADLSEDEAMAALEEAGLEYEAKERVFSDDVERGHIVSQSIDEGEKVKKGTVIEAVVSRGKAIKAPSLKGLTVSEAESAAKKLGLKVEVEKKKYSDKTAKGAVISQTPKADEECEQDDVIAVVVSKGIQQVEVPDVVGKTQEKAEKALKDAKLKCSVTTEYSSSVESGKVVSQSIEAGSKVDKNSTVEISISSGPAPYISSGGGGGRSKKSSGRKSSGGGGGGDSWEAGF